jgi:hypothetical protein
LGLGVYSISLILGIAPISVCLPSLKGKANSRF